MKKRLGTALKTAGIIALFYFLGFALKAGAGPEQVLTVADFSNSVEGGRLPDEWKPLTFKNIPRQTEYSLVKDAGRVVIKAVSEASSSGLIRRIRIDPAEYPLIEWSWKILNVYQKGDVNTKAGDDYPARLYITFEYDPERMGVFEKLKYETARLLYGEYPPGGALNYIWESRLPEGSIVANAYTNRVRMIVVESGPSRLNSWIQEERNVFDDYLAAFHQKPAFISGVAIMTDSDNTGEAATAFYGDIRFKKPAVNRRNLNPGAD